MRAHRALPRVAATTLAAVSALAMLLGDVGRPRAARAADWETTRRDVIDPLNGELHRHLPSYLRQGDLDALVALYDTPTGTGVAWDGAREVPGGEERLLRWETPGPPEAIRERYARLLALMPTRDKVELRIERVGWREPDPDGALPAAVHLVARGTCADGTRCQLEQWADIAVRPEGHGWRITREAVGRRQLVSRAEPRFEVITERAGITNVHHDEGSPAFQLFGGQDQSPVGASGGVGVADVDGDGFEDVFLAGSPDAVLYRNRGDGTFEDVTVAAGLPRPWPAAATSALFFDADNDGWPDLLVGAVTPGGDRFFRNLGGGRFVDATRAAGLPPGRWTASAVAADYDRDGFLDVYLVRMGDHEKTVPVPNHDARNGVPGTLLHNRGDGTFEDVTARAGVAFGGWGLAAAWGDYDDDGWPDLYVTNEFGRNALYRNRHDGRFADVSAASGADDRGAGMSAAWGDYDGDGDLDLYVSNMHANSGWALFHPDFPMPLPFWARLLRPFTAEVDRRASRITLDLLRGSTLLRNDGDGHFTDVSDAAGVRDAQWGWGAEFVDYDDDGRLDVFASDGFISGPLLDDV